MNKVSIIALLTCVSFSPVAMADYEAEKNWFGTVKFNGFVSGSSCDITNGNKTVQLPSVPTSSVIEKYAYGIVPFTINITGCNTKILNPKLRWGPNILMNTTKDGYLKNHSKDGAKNVGLAILNNESQIINLHSLESYNPDESSPEGTLSYTFQVGYIKTGKTKNDEVTPGPVLAQANYHLVYN
ncbi:fimbrial protein [Buttiauxella gaviniae]|uniref:fimbrial protein n=1 Tax=Buttiauxella gaviniae TaxID=82990 RepID=UPI0039B0D3CA